MTGLFNFTRVLKHRFSLERTAAIFYYVISMIETTCMQNYEDAYPQRLVN